MDADNTTAIDADHQAPTLAHEGECGRIPSPQHQELEDNDAAELQKQASPEKSVDSSKERDTEHIHSDAEESTEHVTINIGHPLPVPDASEAPSPRHSKTAESVTPMDGKKRSKNGANDAASTGASDQEREYIEHVLACCVAEDGFDIYQLMAFKSDTKENWKEHVIYALEVLKSVVCALTQCVGIFLVMHDFVEQGLTNKMMCNPPIYDEGAWMAIYHSQLKLLAFLFSSFLAFFSIDQLKSVERGMYQRFSRGANLKLVNLVWLRIGLSVNIFVTIVAVYGSFVTVFFSHSSMDMILNSVALFFLVELDDMLVKADDYATIKHYLEAHDNQTICDEAREEYKAKMKDRNESCVGAKLCCDSCCAQMVHCVGWLYQQPFEMARYVTIGACFVLPIFVGYCY